MDTKRFGVIWLMSCSMIVLFIIAYVLVLVFNDGKAGYGWIYDMILLLSSVFVNLIMYAGYVTARELSKSNLSQRHLNKVLNALQIGLIVCDKQHRIEIVNKHAADFLGFKPTELLNRNIRHLFVEDKDLKQVFEKEALIDNEEVLLKMSSNLAVAAQFSSCPVKNKKDDTVAYVLQIQDVFRKKFEETQEELGKTLRELKEAQIELKKLSLVASSTSNAVIISDPDGLVEWVNDGFCDMTGYLPHEIIGKKPGTVLQGDETDKDVVADIGKQLKLQKEIDVEIINYNKKGEKYWVRMIINPIFNNEYELTNFISVETDITGAKKNEEDLRRAKEKALESKKTKEEFLANMSHEIRTPLNGIMGFTDLLLQDKLNKKQKGYLDAIKDSSDNLLVIINDILDFSKIEAGKIELEEISFNLEELIDKLFKLFQFKAEEKGIVLNKTIDPNVPTLIIGDPVRINQIFTNLISNAIKFTQNGVVTVEIELKKIFDDLIINAVVSDSGIGIPQNKLVNIFDVFTQASSNTTRKFGGTGLGLAIVKKLVEMYKGEIRVESEVGAGTQFIFDLKLKESKETAIEKETITTHLTSLDGIKILVAEDFKMNQLLIKAFLDEWEVETHIVENGKLAVEAMCNSAYDIVLMDVNMPEMDGLEATKLIRQLPEIIKPDIPIIGLTASAINGDKEKGMQNGMNDYVTKPFDQKILYQTMVRLLQLDKDRTSQNVVSIAKSA